MEFFFKLLNVFYRLFRSQPIENIGDSGNKVIEPDRETFFSFMKNLYLQHGVTWEEINLFGIRDPRGMKDSIFNDAIGLSLQGKIYLFKGTTDPSAYYTLNPFKGTEGAAHLCLGNHKNAYQVGEHKGYEAMAQWGNTVKIWRDKNKNFKQDSGDVFETGYFGINIHHADPNQKVDDIGVWGAGCQVIQEINDFYKFIGLVKSSDKFKNKRWATFSYFLFDISQVPAEYIKEGVENGIKAKVPE